MHHQLEEYKGYIMSIKQWRKERNTEYTDFWFSDKRHIMVRFLKQLRLLPKRLNSLEDTVKHFPMYISRRVELQKIRVYSRDIVLPSEEGRDLVNYYILEVIKGKNKGIRYMYAVKRISH